MDEINNFRATQGQGDHNDGVHGSISFKTAKIFADPAWVGGCRKCPSAYPEV
jgi:hypothetical protein